VSVTYLFHPGTVAQATGEGGISTGLSPLPWGSIGYDVADATSSTTTITRAGNFAAYTYTSGDQAVLLSGTGITPGTYTISSRPNNTSIIVTVSPGASGSNITLYIQRPSLAGALVDYPTSLPGPDAYPNQDQDHICCYRPQDGATNQATKLLRLTNLKRTTDDKTLADVITETGATSLTYNGFGARFFDFNEDGLGQAYTIRQQLRNSSGAIGSVITDITRIKDGAGMPNLNYVYYLPPGTIDSSLSSAVSLAAASDSAFGLNLQLEHTGGDAVEACSLFGMNGPIFSITFNTPSTYPIATFCPGPLYRFGRHRFLSTPYSTLIPRLTNATQRTLNRLLRSGGNPFLPAPGQPAF